MRRHGPVSRGPVKQADALLPWVATLGGEAADLGLGAWVSGQESLLSLPALLASRGPSCSLKPLLRFRRQAPGLSWGRGWHCLCGPASQSPVHCGDVTESGEGNVSSCPVQPGSGVNPTPGGAQAPPTPGFSSSGNQAGGLQPAGVWLGSALPTSFPGPSPFPPGWNLDHPVPGWPGRHQACQEWAQLLPWPQTPLHVAPTFPCSCCFKGGVRGTAAGCWTGPAVGLACPLTAAHTTGGPRLPCPPGRGQWSQSRLPSAAPVTVTLLGG